MANNPHLTSQSNEEELGAIVEELTRRLNANETLDVDEIVAEYPAHEEQIRELFPSLQLLQLAAEMDEPGLTDSTAAYAGHEHRVSEQPRELGDFQLIRELGRGGMGVVYEARQISLDIRVALKILPLASVLDRRALARFENEARAAAKLQHPNIVSVHAIGFDKGTHFYAMRLIDGLDLSKVVVELRRARKAGVGSQRNRGPNESTVREQATHEDNPSSDSSWSRDLLQMHESAHSEHSDYFKTIAQIGVQVATALQHAHDMGIVHRDVKPSNIMIDGNGEALLTDFGLAQVKGSAGMTLTGELIGTYQYMSPEQIHAKRIVVDNRSDVYSLGVTLYELLTLSRPFKAENKAQLLRKIAFEEPSRPSKLNRHIGDDLEAIVTTAMEKNPAERYQSASELAEDLRCFLDSRPLKVATKPSWARQTRKWIARHQALATATFLVLVSLVFTGIVSLISIGVAWAATHDAYQSEQEAHKETSRLWRKSDGLRLAAHSALQHGKDPGLAFGLAAEALELHPSREVRSALYSASNLNFEHRTLIGHPSAVGTVSFDSTGQKLVSAVGRPQFGRVERGARLWSVEDGQLTVAFGPVQSTITSAVFAPTGVRILATSAPIASQAGKWDGSQASHSPVLLNAVDGAVLATLEGGFLLDAHARCFNPSGQRLVTPAADDSVQIWDSTTGRVAKRLRGHKGRVTFAAYSPNGEKIVSLSQDGAARIWTAEGELVREITWDGQTPHHASFSPDGRMLATETKRIGIEVWSVEDGERINDEPWPGKSAHFVESGDRLVYQRYQTSRLRRLIDGEVEEEYEGRLLTVGYSVIGDIVVTGLGTELVIWDLNTGDRRGRLQGHGAQVADATIDPTGRYVASASFDHTARIWHVRSGLERRYLQPETAREPLVCRSGSKVAFATAPTMQTRLIDAQNGKTLFSVPGTSWHFDARGNRLVTTTRHTATVFDSQTGRMVAQFSEPNFVLREAHLGRDGAYVLVVAEEGPAWLWRWSQGENVRTTLEGHSDDILEMDVSQQGDLLATSSEDGHSRIWNAKSGESLHDLKHDHPVQFVRFSDDGTKLATTTGHDQGFIWDVKSGAKISSLGSDTSIGFNRIEFLAGGDLVVGFRETNANGVICWKTSGELVGSHPDFRGRIRAAAHPSNAVVAVASSVDGALLWSPQSDQRIGLTKSGCLSAFFVSPNEVVTSSACLQGDPRLFKPELLASIGPPVLQVWDAESGQLKREIAGGAGDAGLASPERILVTGQVHGASVVETQTGRTVATLAGHASPLSHLEFLNDAIVTASWDQTVAIWDADTGRRRRTWRGAAPITTAAVSQKTNTVAWGDANGDLMTWKLAAEGEPEEQGKHSSLVHLVQFDPNGERLLSNSSDGKIRIRELSEGIVQTVEGHGRHAGQLRFSAGGERWLFSPAVKKATPGFRIPTAKNRPSLDWIRVHGGAQGVSLKFDLPSFPINAYFRNKGAELVTFHSDSILLWNVESRGETSRILIPTKNLTRGVLHPEGRIAAIQIGAAIEVWDLDEQEAMFALTSPNETPFILVGLEGEHLFATHDGRLTPYEIDAAAVLSQLPRKLTKRERAVFEVRDRSDWP